MNILKKSYLLAALAMSVCSALSQTTATKSPYDAVLNLALADGSAVSLTLATDQCNVYRAETGDFYMYGTEDGAESARAFWALFGLTLEDLH